MKSSLLAACLFCGCLASFHAKAISYEYDLAGSSSGDSGQIFLDAPSNPAGANTDILSYNITISGNLFTSANSTIQNPSFLLDWTTTMIGDMDLSLKNTSGQILSLTDSPGSGNGVIVGTGVPPGDNNVEWDAPPASVPEHASTLPLFAFALVILGCYYNHIQRPQLAVVAVKR